LVKANRMLMDRWREREEVKVLLSQKIATVLLMCTRLTQSIMYVPLQVNRFQKSILLIVHYEYLKSCSGDFYGAESDPPHKIMRYWFYYSM